MSDLFLGNADRAFFFEVALFEGRFVLQVRRSPTVGYHCTQGGQFAARRGTNRAGRKADTYFLLFGAYCTFCDRQKSENR
jgi:hypothetical protein